jgi:hypothetical protein
LSANFFRTPNIGGIRFPALIDYIPEDKNFALAEDICGSPIERAPIDAEPKVALPLRGETANGRPVEGKIVPTLKQELFVVVQHVQAAFQIAEQNSHGFDSFLVRQVLETSFPHLVSGDAILPFLFGFQV